MLSAGGSSESAQVWALSNYFSNLGKQLYKSMLVFFPFPLLRHALTLGRSVCQNIGLRPIFEK